MSCNWVTMDNSRWFGPCPKCGERVISTFDEDIERDEDRYEPYEDEDTDLCEDEDEEDEDE